jgi:large subunit ribosomal protein L19
MSGSHLKIQALDNSQKRKLPDFRIGDTVRVHYRIREGEKERVQVFQGVVLGTSGSKQGITSTFTVRKVSFGIGVERIFPLHSPRIEKLEVISRGHVRRAKLNYLRELQGKKARLRESKRNAGWASELLTEAAVADDAAATPEAAPQA